MARAKKNHFTIYPHYRHTGQDPIVKKVLSAVRVASNETNGMAAKRSRISPGTIKNWETEKTRRPQHATLAAYIGAYGGKFVIRMPKK